MNKIFEYRRFAEECQRLAQQTQDAVSRNAYLALAKYWRDLSEKYKPPPSQH